MQDGMIFVVLLVGISYASWLINNWIRAKHGYAPESEHGKSELDADRKITLLTSENERQAGQIGRLEERLATLEKIATDPAERVAREIDSLR